MRKKLQARLRELAKIEALATPVTNQIARIVTDAAVSAVKTGHVNIPQQPIQDALLDLMLKAYTRRVKGGRALNLAFSDTTRRTSALVHLDRVHSGFRTLVGNRVLQAKNHYEERINAALQRISAEQWTTRRSVIEMRNAVADMGIAPQNPSLIETLTRTHSQFAFSAAQYTLNKGNPYIRGYLFAAVMDSRTTDQCSSLDGKQFSVNDPMLSVVTPPIHWQCRSQLIELTDDQEWDHAADSVQAVDPEFVIGPQELNL